MICECCGREARDDDPELRNWAMTPDDCWLCPPCDEGLRAGEAKGTRLSREEATALFDLLMVSDPWPLGDAAHQELLRLANSEARKRGYDGWVVAYHEMPRAVPFHATVEYQNTQTGPRLVAIGISRAAAEAGLRGPIADA